ncbi:pre-mRNA-splicing factor 38B-like isoform X1 [Coccinella septempunctata]|uniref:pre-mRNA-splicing factor 38B-like isoform X1 n=1 Tax=Coccinella septempunctata TaxID=41139 RepID=UPI001D06A789|nr:pre-mRNA-splicing factor 38B-like isoform X1 [Coccinella septempunctata]
MNASSSGIWDIPPPPGTEDDQTISANCKMEKASPRAIDSIDPYVKNPHYLEYEKKSGRTKRGSRSKSHERCEKRRRSRSRSRSKSKYRSRRSRSRSRRRRKYSRSKSRSKSRSRVKYRREKDKRSRHHSRSRNHSRPRHSSRSRYSSRSRVSRSRSRSRSKSYRSYRTSRNRRSSKEQSDYEEKPTVDNNYESVELKVEEEEEETEPVKDNAFKNDGSFLEMFKKMQEEKRAQEETQKAEAEKQKLLPAFGKRRGGRVLKTGMVQKSKPQDSEENVHDPWSVYMKEVKKYKEACCDDDSKTRLLVK